jgi:peptide/nickel transport system ATP-binding protein
MSLLRIEGLSVRYGRTEALRDASLDLDAGVSMGLVGESGSGKTTLALAALGLLPHGGRVAAGRVLFDGADLLRLPDAELRRRRWVDLAYVPQGAMNALDPVRDLAQQFAVTLRAHGQAGGRGAERAQFRARAEALFARVGLEARWLDRFPHEYSGGMRQRAAIALAMLFEPRLLIADEPTTGLDVLVQRQVLDLLREARAARGMAMLFVSHDIAIVAELCTRIAVLYAGELVEVGPTSAVLGAPAHPYTMGLRQAVPDIRFPDRRIVSIDGAPPSLAPPPPGCAFAARCPFALDRCRTAPPAAVTLGPGRRVLCHRAEEAPALWAASADPELWRRAG